MLKASWWSVAAVLLIAAAVWAAEDAVTALGITKGEPIDKSFFFMDGKYIHAPYVVERRGAAVYINDVLVDKGPEWPPYDYRVANDPGDPPAGSSPTGAVPPNVDARDTYWSRKARYIYQHYDKQTAQQMMLDLYRKCSALRSVTWDPADPDVAKIVDGQGRVIGLDLFIDEKYMQAPPSKEEVLRRVERTRKSYEDSLSASDVAFFEFSGGSEVILTGDYALAAVAALISGAPRDNVATTLAGDSSSIPETFAKKIAAGFEPSVELSERYRAVKAARDAAESSK